MSKDKDIKEIKSKLKDLLKQVCVDAYEYEIDDVVEANCDIIKNWELKDFQNFLKYLEENKLYGKRDS